MTCGQSRRWLCASLLALAAIQPPAQAAEAAPQPDVKKAAKQLEEVMKLLRQGAKEQGGGEAASKQGAAPAKTQPPAKPK